MARWWLAQQFILVCTNLRATGKERLDVDVGVVNFEVMVSEPASHTDGGQYPCLEKVLSC